MLLVKGNRSLAHLLQVLQDITTSLILPIVPENRQDCLESERVIVPTSTNYQVDG